MIKKLRRLLNKYQTFKSNKKKSSKSLFFTIHTIETLTIAFITAFMIKIYILEVSVVPTGSMIPTLIGGVEGKYNDRLFVNKFIYSFKTPKRGDIIVFYSPHKDKVNYVKRCIGLPGETLKIERGIVYINNKPLILTGVTIKTDYDFYPEITIPENNYFVLGDNRSMSQDSRYWGFVEEKDIIGKALFTWWPLNRMRTLK